MQWQCSLTNLRLANLERQYDISSLISDSMPSKEGFGLYVGVAADHTRPCSSSVTTNEIRVEEDKKYRDESSFFHRYKRYYFNELLTRDKFELWWCNRRSQ